jgi:hypothetical protein
MGKKDPAWAYFQLSPGAPPNKPYVDIFTKSLPKPTYHGGDITANRWLPWHAAAFEHAFGAIVLACCAWLRRYTSDFP